MIFHPFSYRFPSQAPPFDPISFPNFFLMILHLHVFPSQKIFTIKVEDPSSMTLKAIFQAYQSELDLDLPCCFFSQPEQMLLDPTLPLDQNWIACEDHLIVFSLLNRPF